MWQTIGQSRTIDLIQRALRQGSLAHAYILTGPPQVGKKTLALELAMALNCLAEKEKKPCGDCLSCQKIVSGKHADVQVISLNQNPDPEDVKERTEIGIEQIKNMLHSASLPPFEGLHRVYIIDEAGHLSPDAANRLLKTLEEPESRVLFILLTANVHLVPATVISRCQRLNLLRVKTAEIESALITRWNVEPERARLLARLSHGCPGWAKEAANSSDLLQERSDRFEKMHSVMKSDYSARFASAAQLVLQFGKKRETVYEILDTWLSWWRDLLLVKTECVDDIVSIDFLPVLSEMAGAFSLAQIKTAIENIREAAAQLKVNANSRLVLEALMLNLPVPKSVPTTKVKS
jgi:DNA polymerase-3 subunit delta'